VSIPIPNVATFYLKGNCVDDLFHILASNGYKVQMSTTSIDGMYRVDVITDKREVVHGE
jgi:hypothetical protein